MLHLRRRHCIAMDCMFKLKYFWFESCSFWMYFTLENQQFQLTVQTHRQKRSVQGYLSDLTCDVQLLTLRFHGMLFSQLLSLPLSFLPYIHWYPSSFLLLCSPGDSLWHWHKYVSECEEGCISWISGFAVSCLQWTQIQHFGCVSMHLFQSLAFMRQKTCLTSSLACPLGENLGN